MTRWCGNRAGTSFRNELDKMVWNNANAIMKQYRGIVDQWHDVILLILAGTFQSKLTQRIFWFLDSGNIIQHLIVIDHLISLIQIFVTNFWYAIAMIILLNDIKFGTKQQY